MLNDLEKIDKDLLFVHSAASKSGLTDIVSLVLKGIFGYTSAFCYETLDGYIKHPERRLTINSKYIYETKVRSFAILSVLFSKESRQRLNLAELNTKEAKEIDKYISDLTESQKLQLMEYIPAVSNLLNDRNFCKRLTCSKN